jgi:hypothetical protein
LQQGRDIANEVNQKGSCGTERMITKNWELSETKRLLRTFTWMGNVVVNLAPAMHKLVDREEG